MSGLYSHIGYIFLLEMRGKWAAFEPMVLLMQRYVCCMVYLCLS